MNRPLISYILATYNQQQFIREAVESAIAQTYSPLEIILSDDHSTDNTFEIAKKTAGPYNGPHSIRLNRNSMNLGIGGNVNRAMDLCRGELVVGAAGDDVSLPMRTELIWRAWEESGRRATSIFSSYSAMSREGVAQTHETARESQGDSRGWKRLEGELRDFLLRRSPVVYGCTHAWSRRLFDYFGPLRSDLEDSVLSFRTLAIGEMLYIEQPLVKYRRHGGNVSFYAGRDVPLSFEGREKRLRWVDEQSVMAFDNILADIETLYRKGRIASLERARLSAIARRIRDGYLLERQLMDGTFLDRLAVLAGEAKCGNLPGVLRSLARALPRPIYRALYALREKWRRSAQAVHSGASAI